MPEQSDPDVDDRRQIESVGRGDSGAHRALFDRYHGRVYGFVLRRLRDPVLADEVVADVFFEVWRSATKFRGESTVATWIFGIANYKSMGLRRDLSREAARYQPSPNNVEALHSAVAEGDLDRLIDARQALRKVEHSLASLSKEQREVIHLAFVDGLEYEEIANRLGISKTTVKTRVNRARRRMRKDATLLEGLRP